MKVLILPDEPSWIINRITDRMISGMPEFSFTKRFYIGLPPAELVALANEHDLVHYQNWILPQHVDVLPQIRKPVLMSIRSHRYAPHARETAKRVRGVHVVSPALWRDFPGAAYIPDGLLIKPQPLRVGFAGKPDAYKGFPLIEQACKEIGAEFFPATDLGAHEMRAYYRAIDVLVCASEAEGFGTPVMECLALNKPVVSVRVGVPWACRLPGVTWVQRTVDGIAAGLCQHWPARRLEAYRWERVCGQFADFYRGMVS